MKDEILKEISALLADNKLSWDKCQRLSALYGALQAVLYQSNINSLPNDKIAVETNSRNISDELADILPALSQYNVIKEQYRQGQIAETAVLHYAEKLTVEINEFITALKAHATEAEREVFAKIK